MKIPSRKAIKQFQEIVSKKCFIYHISTLDKFEQIYIDGEIRSRNEIENWKYDYSLPDLIEKRASIFLPAGRRLHDAVPFYFTPRQPMFSRLIREEKIRPDEIVAIGFNFDVLHSRYKHWIFSTNPAYEGSTYLGDWFSRYDLHWDVLEKWHWNSDASPKEIKIRESWKRQAEIFVESPVPLYDVSHLIVDSTCIAPELFVKFNTCKIEGIFEW